MLSRSFIVLWLAMFVAMIGISMVSPLLPVYVSEDLGGPDYAVALSFSGIAVTMLIAAPIVGRYGDVIGAKPLITVGFFVYAIGGFGYVIAESWEAVVAFRMLSGLGAAAFFPMAMAYVGRLAPRGREGTMMGMFAVAQVAGFGVGPLIGGGIRDAFSAEAAFISMSLMLIVTGVLTFLLLPARPTRVGASRDGEDEPDEPRVSAARLLRIPEVQAAIAVQAIVALGWGAGATFLTVYVVSDEGLGTGSATFAGLLLAGRSVTGGLLQPLFGRLADRASRLLLVLIGLSVAGVAQTLVPEMPRWIIEPFGEGFVIMPALLVLYMVIGIAESVAWPAQQAIFVEVGRRVGMGSIMGLNQMGSSLGFLVGSLVGAALVSTLGLESAFRYAGISMVLGAGLFFLLMRRAERPLAEGSSEFGAAADR